MRSKIKKINLEGHLEFFFGVHKKVTVSGKTLGSVGLQETNFFFRPKGQVNNSLTHWEREKTKQGHSHQTHTHTHSMVNTMHKITINIKYNECSSIILYHCL